MRLRAGMGLLCVALLGWALAGCQHLPKGVKVDLANQVVEVGPCQCPLPRPGAEKPVEAPAAPVQPVKEEPDPSGAPAQSGDDEPR